MRAPRLSVVIPAYNAAKFIAEALVSVFSQKNAPPFEVIVVDDGSRDETAAIVERNFPAVRLVRKTNGGPGSARNRGVEEARGEIVIFLDADDRMLDGRLAFQGNYMLDHQEVGLSFGNQMHECSPNLDMNRNNRICDSDDFELVEQAFPRLVVVGNFIANTASAVRRDIYLLHGRQPEHIFVAEDYAMNLKIARHAKVAASCRFLSWYRFGDGSNLMRSEHAYLGPTLVLAHALRDHGDELTFEERLQACKRFSRLADALLRFEWIERGTAGVAARIEAFEGLIPANLVLKWRILSHVPPSIGYALRYLRRRAAPLRFGLNS
jgi:glycosyltransferase involved in cell wall biosynthesis